MSNAVAEATGVPKTQKTFYLDDDLIRLLNAHARSSGASFTRQVTAAVLQYLFSRPEGPDPYWMEFAVALDDGVLPLDELLHDREQTAVAEQQFILKLQNDAYKRFPDNKWQGDVEVVEHYDTIASRAEEAWKAMQEPAATNAVIRITQHWKQARQGAGKVIDTGPDKNAGDE